MSATASVTAAPGRKPVDWAELRSLHVKGLNLRELADQYGVSYDTVRSRASREKWCNTVATARESVTQRATEQLKASISTWVGKIDKLMHVTLGHVEERIASGKALKTGEIVQLVDCTEKLNRIFRVNGEMDRDAQSNKLGLAVSVNVQGNASCNASRIIEIESIKSVEAGDESA